MVRALSRSLFALWLPLLLASGCQRVREDRAINFQKDGDQVAFQHGNNGVFVANQKGGPPTLIVEFGSLGDVQANVTGRRRGSSRRSEDWQSFPF